MPVVMFDQTTESFCNECLWFGPRRELIAGACPNCGSKDIEQENEFCEICSGSNADECAMNHPLI